MPVLAYTTVATTQALPSFFTTFSGGTENPISEGGNWNGKPVPAVFTNAVQKSGGIAFDGGTATSVNDAVAVVNTQAFNPVSTKVRITITLSVTGAIGAGEVEIHFNNHFTSTDIQLYELDFTNGGILAVKWLGPQGSIFFPLSTVSGGGGWSGGAPPSTGDTVTAERTDNGSVVTISVVHTPISTGIPFSMLVCQDSLAISGSNIYTTGQPGMGFDNGTNVFAIDSYRCENF